MYFNFFFHLYFIYTYFVNFPYHDDGLTWITGRYAKIIKPNTMNTNLQKSTNIT